MKWDKFVVYVDFDSVFDAMSIYIDVDIVVSHIVVVVYVANVQLKKLEPSQPWFYVLRVASIMYLVLALFPRL
jgi:hypothetical protein